MRKLLLLLLSAMCLCIQAKAQYTDHRFHKVDSLEAIMAGWTAADLARAGEPELINVANDLRELMFGFLQTNKVKSEYYARMLLDISRSKGWLESECQAAKIIGQHFWASEQYDSATVYYGMAMDAIEKMPVTEDDADHIRTYNKGEKDSALSAMYGTLGNLYSIQDSTELAMEYYGKAGVIFKEHGWDSSCAVLYGNMGETMREKGRFTEAKSHYLESLKYARQTGDSLLLAGAYKGLGSLYLDTGKTAKAMRYLNDANKYYADHEDEELYNRMESLNYTQQALTLQKKHMSVILLLLAVAIVLAAMTFYINKKLKKTAQEKTELTEVLEEAVETINNVPKQTDVTLKPREKEILGLISNGYTNAQIADALCLSQETIKWYKKKLFAMFDASNSAELVTIAKDKGLL